MSAAIDGEVWEIDGVPLFIKQGITEDSNHTEFFRVRDIFQYNSINSTLANRGGVFIPRRTISNTEEHVEWIAHNQTRIIDGNLPIVRCVNNKWLIDLTLVNNIYDTATIIV